MRRILALLMLVLMPGLALAQQSDKDFLTGWLEKNLSGAGRIVTIEGFAGALSSRATMAEMTIADAKGIWLTMKDVTLDWDRAALLSGQIEIREFSAGEIVLERSPETGESGMPSPEARGFNLPDLPVSVNIQGIAARHIVLGEGVAGQRVEGSLSASMRLAGGEGAATIEIARSDGKAGKFSLISSYSNRTRQLNLALTVAEEAGGVAVSLLGVPGEPAAELIVAGSGPVSAFQAKVAFSTDGVTRLAGDIGLTGDGEASGFSVDLAGDPSPVFLPRYAEFFGHSVRLRASGQRGGDGRLALRQFSLAAQALKLDGSLSLDAQGLPEAFDLTGQVGLANGPVVLPLTTQRETRLTRAEISLKYDRATGDAWQGRAVVSGLDHAALTARTVTLGGTGRIGRNADGPLFDGRLDFASKGLAMADPGLAQALGTKVDGQADFSWAQGEAKLAVSNLAISGEGYRIATTGGIGGLADGFALKGTAAGSYDDLSRLSTLTGRALAGSLGFDLTGEGSPLSGFFDIEGSLTGKDLVTGVAQLDGLLTGDSAISLSARRDATGTTINSLELTATSLTATAEGRLTSEGSSLTADVDFTDISVLGAGYRGAVKGKASLLGSFADGTAGLEATGTGLAVGQEQIDRLLAGESKLTIALTFKQGVATIDRASVANGQVSLQAAGLIGAAGNDVTADLQLPDLAVLGGPYRGALTGQAKLTGPLDAAKFSLSGTTTDLATGQAPVDRLIGGESSVAVAGTLRDGAAVIDSATIGNDRLTLQASGRVSARGNAIAAMVTMPDLAVLGMPVRGALEGTARLDGTFENATIGFDGSATDFAIGQPRIDGLLAGASRISLAAKLAEGRLRLDRAALTNPYLSLGASGQLAVEGSDVTARIVLADLSGLGAGYRGSATGEARFTGTLTEGHVEAAAQSVNLALGQTQVDTLLRGQSNLTLNIDLASDGIRINRVKLTSPQLTAEATGTATGDERRLVLDARLANLAVLYPQFPGALTVTGSAVQDGAGYRLDLAARGPGQIDAAVTGSLGNDFGAADLAISGTATAALANELAAPRSLSGPVSFSLRLNGPLKLASLSGPVSISGGRLADPGQNFSLQDINLRAQLGGGRAQLSGSAGVSTGGRLDISGGIGLEAPYAADLEIAIQSVTLRDPDLYTTTADGAVTFQGPATGGAVIAGTVTLGRTELRIPSTGLGADGDLPGLLHFHEPGEVHATRLRAGLLGDGGAGGPGGPGYGLSLRISAPNQVFLRGRGLDAELGGSLVLRGTTQAIVPSGGFELIRGRLDILGKRLVLGEASLQLQGALVPYIRIVASVASDDVTATITIEGPANDPVVSFSSTPDLPQEEVLARLLFDRGLANVTPFQAIQLASAVATLAGRGGDGIIGGIRKGAGLDNLDIQTDATGNTQLTLGKYISDKIYTEVQVEQGGESSISLNFDVTANITVKGHVDSDGSTGIGVYLQKDY